VNSPHSTEFRSCYKDAYTSKTKRRSLIVTVYLLTKRQLSCRRVCKRFREIGLYFKVNSSYQFNNASGLSKGPTSTASPNYSHT